jgi:hypothetical protein
MTTSPCSPYAQPATGGNCHFFDFESFLGFRQARSGDFQSPTLKAQGRPERISEQMKKDLHGFNAYRRRLDPSQKFLLTAYSDMQF